MISYSIALTLAAFLAPQDPSPDPGGPELLPVAPEGWRFERMDFPLGFAPDLDHEGFEELRFAPGMFDPESDSYFSYAIALRLNGDHDVDASFWKEFLEGYYRGLCVAVGQGRGLEIDPDAITATIEEVDGRVYVATIDMVDAFVTGEPLRLRLELESEPTPLTTELFGIVSPLPPGAGVWADLDELRSRWRTTREMPVFLNHLFVVPDAETYEALAASRFLRQSFGSFEARRTVRADMSYEGVYWYGARTYFEFLPPGSPPLIEGATGLAFGVEWPRGTTTLATALRERDVQTFAGPRTRELDGEAVPWFEIMGISAASMESKLSLFTMEYDPAFLARWRPALPPEHSGISRSAVLERYAAGLSGNGEPLFQDITEVYLSLDDAERSRLAAVCDAFGYLVDEGDATIYHGPQFRLVVRASESPGGIIGFRMSLRREVKTQTQLFGTAKLHLKGHTATFYFGD